MSLKELDEIFELHLTLELLALHKAFEFLDKEEIMVTLAEWRATVFPKDQTLEQTLQTVAGMNESLHGLYLSEFSAIIS
jgi:hypothetical protein